MKQVTIKIQNLNPPFNDTPDYAHFSGETDSFKIELHHISPDTDNFHLTIKTNSDTKLTFDRNYAYWANLKSIKIINLSRVYKLLSITFNDSFNLLSGLITLYANPAVFSFDPTVDFTKLPLLEKLQLTDSQLSAIPDYILQMSNLKSLVLSSNSIASLADLHPLSQLTNLSHLNISDNPVAKLVPSNLIYCNTKKDIHNLITYSLHPPDHSIKTLTLPPLIFSQSIHAPITLAPLTALQQDDLNQNGGGSHQVTHLPQFLK